MGLAHFTPMTWERKRDSGREPGRGGVPRKRLTRPREDRPHRHCPAAGRRRCPHPGPPLWARDRTTRTPAREMSFSALVSRGGGQCLKEQEPRPQMRGTGLQIPRNIGSGGGSGASGSGARLDPARPRGGADPRSREGQRTSGGGARSRDSGAASREVSSLKALAEGPGLPEPEWSRGGAELPERRHGRGGAAAGERRPEGTGRGRGLGGGGSLIHRPGLRPHPQPLPVSLPSPCPAPPYTFAGQT